MNVKTFRFCIEAIVISSKFLQHSINGVIIDFIVESNSYLISKANFRGRCYVTTTLQKREIPTFSAKFGKSSIVCLHERSPFLTYRLEGNPVTSTGLKQIPQLQIRSF